MLDLSVNETRPDTFAVAPEAEACAPGAILFENADWRLLGDGLEHRDTGYFIGRDMLAMRRGDLWEWPLHLAEKNWCTPRLFREAFVAALEVFGVDRDAMLAQSFAMAFGLTAGSGRAGERDAFVALGDVVRPKSASGTKAGRVGGLARKRTAGPRLPVRRNGSSTPLRTADTTAQRAAL